MKGLLSTGLFLILLAGTAGAQGPEQEWYKYYEDAKSAIERGEWQAAVDSLQVCVVKKPRSRQKAEKYSHFYTEYYPYYFQARAYFGLGKYETAEERLKEEERQAEILKDQNYSIQFAELRQRVQKALAEQRRPAPPADPAAGLRRVQEDGEESFRKGDYAAARGAFQRVQQEAPPLDPKLAEKASKYLADMDLEEKAWADAQRLLREGNEVRALESVNVVIRLGGRHAEEAARLQGEAQQRLAGKQSLQDSLADVRALADKGQYAEALGLLGRLEEKSGGGAELQPVRADLLRRLLRDAAAQVERDPGLAETQVSLAEKNFPDSPEVRALRQRLEARKNLLRAEDLLRRKRWAEAKPVLESLLAVPEFRTKARADIDTVARMQQRLARDLAGADARLVAGDTAGAREILKALQPDFPDDPQIWPRLQRIQQSELRSGTGDVEEYLQSALTYFFESGDYPEARMYLSEYLKRQGSRKDLALFFRAMAAIYLQRLEGGSGKRYLDEARQDVAGISAGFQPPRNWISGAALRYYDQWRRGR